MTILTASAYHTLGDEQAAEDGVDFEKDQILFLKQIGQTWPLFADGVLGIRTMDRKAQTNPLSYSGPPILHVQLI